VDLARRVALACLARSIQFSGARQVHAEVLLIATCPALGGWDMMNDLAEATRVVDAEKKTGLADVATAFHPRGTEEAQRAALFKWDKTHPGEMGHRLAVETVFQALQQERQLSATIFAPSTPYGGFLGVQIRWQGIAGGSRGPLRPGRSRAGARVHVMQAAQRKLASLPQAT
jgi:hypothetical protein